ncbi:Endonuclease/exonuclease/phosphatase superfamily [Arabidopsis suecica]|uniref:Endonuclease/exonuclease/phosphatase superfamily n=1 Tax=Arabidopsis suecica TaxID=45249 RepID=A0A8T2CPX4_ARASU|nr:Endonuclease/exonuclease/phosphatase superfamily [Arabidopsis suecica]
MIHSCGLIDFPFHGNQFSWIGQRANGKIRCRLDRAMGNEEWHNLFSHTNVEYLEMWGSDHRPVLASIQSSPKTFSRKFMFDKRWIGKPGLNEAVIEGWSGEGLREDRPIMKKIQNCKRVISIWKKSTRTNSEILIKELHDKIEENYADDNASVEALRDLKKQLGDAYTEEEIFWYQKSRQNWLALGDKNTKYFHALTKQRRAKNKILGILDNNGVWVDNEEGIERVAVDYFEKLFTTSNPIDPSMALRDISPSVSSAMNESLVKEVTEEEVKRALFSLNPTKAPGPDGMTALFFQKF